MFSTLTADRRNKIMVLLFYAELPKGAAFLMICSARQVCGGEARVPHGRRRPEGVGRRREAPEASPRTECGPVQTEGKRSEEAGCARKRQAGG